MHFNPLSANPTKWSNTLKQFVSNLPMNCLTVFDHFVKLALKGLSIDELPLKGTTVFLKADLFKRLSLSMPRISYCARPRFYFISATKEKVQLARPIFQSLANDDVK